MSSVRPISSVDDTAQLWQLFSRRLRGFIAGRVNNDAEVEDILQEVFVKAQRAAGQLRDAERLTTWLFRIAENTIIDHYRSAARRREIPVDGFELVEPAPSADAEIEDPAAVRAELAACMRPVIDVLPQNARQALELVELEGLSQTEAARRLGLSVSGMKSRVQRARAQAHEQLTSWCSIAVDRRGGPVECVPSSGGPCG